MLLIYIYQLMFICSSYHRVKTLFYKACRAANR